MNHFDLSAEGVEGGRGRNVVRAFVSLPFEEGFDPVFETVSKVFMLRGLTAIRAQRVHAHTPRLNPTTVTSDMRDSRFIIADLTGNHPNVLQDVHDAIELGKLPILISQKAPEETEFHVRGWNIHPYEAGDLSSLQSLLLEIAFNLSNSVTHQLVETPFDGVSSAKIVLKDIVPGRWKNPFADG